MSLQQRIEDVKRAGRFKGRRELLSHFQGKSLSRAQAIAAMCFDCFGYFDGGAEDCENPECPLYGYMPYRTHKVKKIRSEAQQRADVSRTALLKKKRALTS